MFFFCFLLEIIIVQVSVQLRIKFDGINIKYENSFPCVAKPSEAKSRTSLPNPQP